MSVSHVNPCSDARRMGLMTARAQVKERSSPLFLRSLYYNEKSSYILTRIHVLAKTNNSQPGREATKKKYFTTRPRRSQRQTL